MGLILKPERSHFQVFRYCHLGKDMAAFRHMSHSHGDDFVRFGSHQILTVQKNATGCRLFNPGNGVQGCRFSRTVCTNQRDNFSFVYCKADIPNCMNGTIMHIQFLDIQHLSHYYPSFRVSCADTLCRGPSLHDAQIYAPKYAPITFSLLAISYGVPFAMI